MPISSKAQEDTQATTDFNKSFPKLFCSFIRAIWIQTGIQLYLHILPLWKPTAYQHQSEADDLRKILITEKQIKAASSDSFQSLDHSRNQTARNRNSARSSTFPSTQQTTQTALEVFLQLHSKVWSDRGSRFPDRFSCFSKINTQVNSLAFATAELLHGKLCTVPGVAFAQPSKLFMFWLARHPVLLIHKYGFI